MRSKNKRSMDSDEQAFVTEVKMLDCGVCGASFPSEAHEPRQGLWFLCVPLCFDCHRGPHGWHGDKSRWRAAKLTPELVQNETIRRVIRLRAGKPQIAAPGFKRARTVERKRSSLSSDKIVKRAA